MTNVRTEKCNNSCIFVFKLVPKQLESPRRRLAQWFCFEVSVWWIFFWKIVQLDDGVLLCFAVLPGMVFLQKRLHLELPLLVWGIGFVLQLRRLVRSVPSSAKKDRLNICFLSQPRMRFTRWFKTLNHSLVFCSDGNAEHDQGCNADNESNYDDPTCRKLGLVRLTWQVPESWMNIDRGIYLEFCQFERPMIRELSEENDGAWC